MKKAKNARHSKADPNWMTPGEGQPVDYLARIRRCLGGRIGFDPFSSHVANQAVQAVKYLTPAEDGFTAEWEDDVHINPPGLQIKKAWGRLCAEVYKGTVTRAMWTGFSVEQLCVLAEPNREGETNQDRWARAAFYPGDFSMVFLRKRIPFVRESGETGDAPSHGNYIVGIGVPHGLFEEVWAPLGQVLRGPLSVDE